jgi:hypothetical protein
MNKKLLNARQIRTAIYSTNEGPQLLFEATFYKQNIIEI